MTPSGICVLRRLPGLVDHVGDRPDDEVRVAAVDEVVARLGV
jgi:hypothetical protein